ncbi:phosphate starvation-inducible protein PhoH [Planococcus plakortidis]|uniref:PhoH-like protein n=1 Tax=Planococcus plakortidis TaxID=1038856 RepID=A0A1C7E714_9BACL|nr:PhoH family protein [Planococcus plakortidis]ANU19267.1 phosphate starvation-inducible protein PhoH [Planococcus plakortidis]
MTNNSLLELHVKDPNEAVLLLGTSDSHLSLIEESFDIHIITRGEVIRLEGSEEGRRTVKLLLEQLLKVIRKGINIDQRDIVSAIEMAKNGTIEYFAELYDEEVARSATGRSIRAKTIGQRHYIHAIKRSDMVFGIGPAGTGKTYLAVVLAVQALKNGQVKKIVLTRPAVEAGESLGFLPGDLKEKVDPYLRPLYDALHDVMGQEQTNRLIERGTIEVAPLAYMRGRTLEEAFIILDESQNTTKAQMKMFLTRLGFNSKMIITGDKTQIDLPRGAESGLIAAEKNLHGVKGIAFQYLEKGDVVRHPLVSKIIEAYENQPG